ncbi:hypothetical protein ABIE65_003152 [Constrictibacter sp. MBR-5]|jgi:hypothetical protein|uniref:hypothetical protein n=1 Tax=Constrictibacter sp. MBR-5 TaxID=3156467 RepID=UPI0033918BD2
MDRRETDLSAAVYMGLVLVPLAAQVVARLLDPWYGGYVAMFNGEAGFIELGTAALLFAATLLLARTSRRLWRDGERANAILAAILAFGAFVVMGEEVSWGQWLFHWDSPDWFLTHNEQGETNLHNLAFVKKDIPKWLVVIGIAVFGVVMPMRGSRREGRIGPFDGKMLPTTVCVPVALVVAVSHVVVKLFWWIGSIELEPLIGIDVREATEFYIALFGLIYAMSLGVRLQAFDRTRQVAPTPRQAGHPIPRETSGAKAPSASLPGKTG